VRGNAGLGPTTTTTTPPALGRHPQENLMAFDALEQSLTVLDQLASVEPKIRQRRKSLADEIGRAAESVALNISEARQRAGLDRPDLYRRAAGSAAELTFVIGALCACMPLIAPAMVPTLAACLVLESRTRAAPKVTLASASISPA
jgi:hypothetical protein